MGKTIICPNCKGTGEVKLGSGGKVTCSPCDGNGYTVKADVKVPCPPC